MQYVVLQPGDATMYTAVYEKTDGRLFFAFNSGGDSPLFGFLWPLYLGYISYSYFLEKVGHFYTNKWTAGIAYLVLLHLLGLEPSEKDLVKGALSFITEEGRLHESWLDVFPKGG